MTSRSEPMVAGEPAGRLLPIPAFGLAPVVGTILIVLFALPVATLLVRAVVTGALAEASTSTVVLDALTLSLATTAVSVVLTVAIGMPVAFMLARHHFRGIGLLEAVIDLPIVLPPSVAGLALLLVLGRRGLFGPALDSVGVTVPFTTLAVILAQTFVSAPFFIRAAKAGLVGVDRDIEDAARADGASEWRVLAAVTVPLAGPALAAGLAMAWARALGEFGATIMFAGNIAGRTETLPLVVYGEFQSGGLDSAIAAGAVLVIAAFGVLVAVRGLRSGAVLDIRGGR